MHLAEGAPLLPFDGADPVAAEQYKIARTRILQHPGKPRCLVVSSAQVDDGKSVSAVNLAGCLALKSQTSVLLVDADMRRSRLASQLGVPASPGLSEVLGGQCTLEEAAFRLDPMHGLYFLPRGERAASPAELLDSSRWRGLATMLKREFGFVVIDAPPIGLVADYDLVQDVADGVILVVRPDHTNRTLCMKTLASVPAEKMVGVLLNCFNNSFLTRPAGHRYDYYYYGCADGTGSAEQPPATMLRA
jgi:capsular exopolysaccharide synthesis family protein